VLNEIERKTEFKFLYEDEILNNKEIVSITATKEKLSNVLNTLFKNANIGYKVVDKQIVLKPKIVLGVQKTPSFLGEIKFNFSEIFNQQTLSGTITDENGQPLA